MTAQLDQMYMLNNIDMHTHIPHQANFNFTSHDINFCSPSLAPSITWTTKTDLSSDHFPILITVRTTPDTFSHAMHVITNYKRAAF